MKSVRTRKQWNKKSRRWGRSALKKRGYVWEKQWVWFNWFKNWNHFSGCLFWAYDKKLFGWVTTHNLQSNLLRKLSSFNLIQTTWDLHSPRALLICIVHIPLYYHTTFDRILTTYLFIYFEKNKYIRFIIFEFVKIKKLINLIINLSFI